MGTVQRKKLDGIIIRRQHGIGPYVVDFYHALSRTVIEIDGSVHDDEEVLEADRWREGYLLERGYKIMRFKNYEVISDINLVLQRIKTCVTDASSATPPCKGPGVFRPPARSICI